MSTETKTFHIGDILSITTGCLVSPSHIGGVYEILNWLTGESLMTHQLPRVSEECAPGLAEQFPDLAAVRVPAGIDSEASLTTWLASLKEEYGETRPVRRLPAGKHVRIDPLTELSLMRRGMPVIVVELGPELTGGAS